MRRRLSPAEEALFGALVNAGRGGPPESGVVQAVAALTDLAVEQAEARMVARLAAQGIVLAPLSPSNEPCLLSSKAFP